MIEMRVEGYIDEGVPKNVTKEGPAGRGRHQCSGVSSRIAGSSRLSKDEQCVEVKVVVVAERWVGEMRCVTRGRYDVPRFCYFGPLTACRIFEIQDLLPRFHLSMISLSLLSRVYLDAMLV